ncbi:MAG: glycosyltransferase [Cytophagales bacterium]|nr:glycosyltransferase [Cytophagales bacterium]
MRVGVIVTVYNLERFVAQAITSVLNQTRPADQIIVVNDGSTDNSLQVIEQFLPHVQLITNSTNQGVLPSVIEAIKLTEADIIALLDGDDVWEADKLQIICGQFEHHANAMMMLHTYQRMDANGAVLAGRDVTQSNLQRIEALKHKQDQDELLKESILSYRGVWLGSALTFRRSYLAVAAFESWSQQIWGHELSHQDQPLAAYLILTNPDAKIQYVHQPLFRYRIFGENSSGSSATLPRAIKTLQRSKATLLRTHQLVTQMPSRVVSLARQQQKLNEISYLEALYEKKFRVAFGLFTKLFFRFWTTQQKAKETVRFAGVFLLGPEKFLSKK